LVESADDMARESGKDPYGRGLNSYYWGSAGVVARMSYNLVLAHKIYPNQTYLDAISLKVDHLLGLNPFARSWVTGLGANPPQNPHHRPSVSDGVAAPWPGLLIGGANPDALSWEDDYASYEQNEIAINWNTALVYALVAARGTATDESADCVPNCLPEPSLGGAGGLGGSGP
jgi:endoglucanase